MHSRFQLVVLTSVAFLTASLVVRGQNQTTQAPVFKSKVEIVQLDVSVLDKHRQPVKGLTEKDFTILEDGKPQKIVGFTTFDMDNAEPPATGWMKDVPPDVTTNDLKPESRLFVLVMDDALIPQDPFSIRASKDIAKSIIDKLGPNDLTAIVFTGDNRKTQDFTSDKTKLTAAVDKFNPGLAGWTFGYDLIPRPDAPITDPSAVPIAPMNPDSWFYASSIRTLSSVADYLIAVPNRRKALFWVSPGVPMDLLEMMPKKAGQDALSTSGGGKGTGLAPPPPSIPIADTVIMRDVATNTESIFRRAQLANVTIYPIDPTGLGGMRAYLLSRIPDYPGPIARKVNAFQDFLVSAAANTGGRTVMNTNDFETGITEIFEENKSYYLVAFEPTNTKTDGTLRRIQVKVDRPDVDVRSRSEYYAPEAATKEDKKIAKSHMTAEAVALSKAMAGILPTAGMPMKASVATFAVPGQRLSTVTVVLGVRQPIPADAANGRVTETTELLTSAYTPEGDPKGAQRHTAKVVLRAGSNGEAAYEVLARIDLPAGRYQLRLAAHNTTAGKDGSVFVDVTVPDYSNIPFSASQVVLSASPGRVSAPKDLFTPLLPLVPTAERQFATNDKVTAFLRLYQSGQKPVDKVAMTFTVRDAKDTIEASETRPISADQFPAAGQDLAPSLPLAQPGRPALTPTPTPAADKFANLSLRTADVKYAIPMTKLSPGPHLLAIEATLGVTTIRRDVRFEVR